MNQFSASAAAQQASNNNTPQRHNSSRSLLVALFSCVAGVLLGRALVLGGMLMNVLEISYDDHDNDGVLKAAAIQSNDKQTIIPPVDCHSVPPIEPVNIGRMSSHPDVPYLVSFSWWDYRIKRPNFKRGWELKANPSVRAIQRLLMNTTASGGAFVDVGANVGFMTNFATCLKNSLVVFAIDPISYDIAKICEGLRANVEKQYASNTLQLYHAAAGAINQPNVTIIRPSDQTGFFDQSSLTREAVLKQDLTEEHIPMVRVDSIIPDSVRVGVVKIDVQGHEYEVLMGMTRLLSRKQGYPTHVYFEESEEHLRNAGKEPGACSRFLESYGYTCAKEINDDVLCSKY